MRRRLRQLLHRSLQSLDLPAHPFDLGFPLPQPLKRQGVGSIRVDGDRFLSASLERILLGRRAVRWAILWRAIGRDRNSGNGAENLRARRVLNVGRRGWVHQHPRPLAQSEHVGQVQARQSQGQRREMQRHALDSHTVPADLDRAGCLGRDELAVRGARRRGGTVLAEAVVAIESVGAACVSGVPDRILLEEAELIRRGSASCVDMLPETNEKLQRSVDVAADINGGSGIPEGDDKSRKVLSDFGASVERAPQASPGPVVQGIANTLKKWATGSTVSVGFHSQTSSLIGACRAAMTSWSSVTCLEFSQTSFRAADIRVSFQPGRGHYSLVGTDSRMARNQPRFFSGISALNESLNLDPNSLLGNVTESRRVALHEFGHAVGMLHEQFHKLDKIDWIESRVYAHFFMRYGWNRSKTKSNVLDVAGQVGVDQTADRDGTSIMHYWFPESLHRNGDAVPKEPNDALSVTDKEFMRKQYSCKGSETGDDDNPVSQRPKPAEVPRALKVGSDGLSSEIRTAGEIRYFRVEIVSGAKYVVETFDFPSTPIRLKLYAEESRSKPIASDAFGGEAILNARLTIDLPQGAYILTAEHIRTSAVAVGNFKIRVRRK